MEQMFGQKLLDAFFNRSVLGMSSVGLSAGGGLLGGNNISDFAYKLWHLRRQERAEADQVCGPTDVDAAVSASVEAFTRYGAGVSISALGVAGLVGNLLSFLTIVTMKRRSLFHNLLLTLTFFDVVFLVNGGIFFVWSSFKFQSNAYNLLFPKIIYPFGGIAMTGSTYSCIAIALERFLGICYAQSAFVIRRSRHYICAIAFISLVIDSPRFFEISPVLEDDATVVGFKYSELRKNPTYIVVYTLWLRLIFTALLPFILMLVFNLKILLYYKKNSFAFGGSASPQHPTATSASTAHTHLQSQMSREPDHISPAPSPLPPALAAATPAPPQQQSQERILYITFACLTITFLICHTPRILLNINELYTNEQKTLCRLRYNRNYQEPEWVLVAKSIEQILLIFNSSINFVYYCLVGKTFRQHMCRKLFWWCNACLRVVAGIDGTTTAGTGETTVPDLESKIHPGFMSTATLAAVAARRQHSAERTSSFAEEAVAPMETILAAVHDVIIEMDDEREVDTPPVVDMASAVSEVVEAATTVTITESRLGTSRGRGRMAKQGHVSEDDDACSCCNSSGSGCSCALHSSGSEASDASEASEASEASGDCSHSDCSQSGCSLSENSSDCSKCESRSRSVCEGAPSLSSESLSVYEITIRFDSIKSAMTTTLKEQSRRKRHSQISCASSASDKTSGRFSPVFV